MSEAKSTDIEKGRLRIGWRVVALDWLQYADEWDERKAEITLKYIGDLNSQLQEAQERERLLTEALEEAKHDGKSWDNVANLLKLTEQSLEITRLENAVEAGLELVRIYNLRRADPPETIGLIAKLDEALAKIRGTNG